MQSAAMPDTIVRVSKKELEELIKGVLHEELQPIKDRLDAINKMLDGLTNQGLAPKTPPKETDIRPQD